MIDKVKKRWYNRDKNAKARCFFVKKKIFLLGDSISLHYNPILIPATADKYEWETKPGRAEALKNLDIPVDANGGTSRSVLSFLRDEEARDALHYDYLLFNCGLHDIVQTQKGGAPRVDAGEYHKNVTEIVELALSHGIKPIWVYTTPVEDARHNKKPDFLRFNTNVLLYNAIALEIMKKHKVPMINLYTFTAAIEGEKYADHVHYIEPVRKMQAEFIAQALEKILAEY